jgi:hypothetical protein
MCIYIYIYNGAWGSEASWGRESGGALKLATGEAGEILKVRYEGSSLGKKAKWGKFLQHCVLLPFVHWKRHKFF